MRDVKQRRWALQFSQLTALRNFSGHASGRGNANRVQWFPEPKRHIWESGDTKATKILTLNGTEEEMAVHKKFWRSADGPPEVFSLVMISASVWRNYLQLREKSLHCWAYTLRKPEGKETRVPQWMSCFKPAFSLSSFTFIQNLFSSSLSAIRVVSSEYLRLIIFLLAILIPAWASSILAFHMIYSA